MTQTQQATYQALINLDLGRPFPAKFPGVCALTGIKFHAHELIRKVGDSYCAQRTLSLTGITMAPLEIQAERTAPFDADKLERWLAESGNGWVTVFGANGTQKVYRPGRQSSAQLRARTRQAVWMVRC